MAQIIPIRDLKDTNAISARCHELDEPIYITKNGYGDMVIMSMEVYEEKLDTSRILSALAVAEEDIRTGKIRDAFAALKKHGRSMNFEILVTRTAESDFEDAISYTETCFQ